jgi:hypothetical protein
LAEAGAEAEAMEIMEEAEQQEEEVAEEVVHIQGTGFQHLYSQEVY